jgi:hypothetical protein
MREIAAKGGHASHSGGFASMDPERVVWFYLTFPSFYIGSFDVCLFRPLIRLSLQKEIASKGGKASHRGGNPGNFANR